MTDQIIVPTETVLAWTRYQTARLAKSTWTAEEKEAKAHLLKELGYDPEDPKPEPCEVASSDGELLFEVRVGERKGLDVKYFRDTHPDIYAMCERVSHPVSIREVEA